MDAHVHGELGALVEAGAALPAAERLLLLVLGVRPHVVADVALEALAAHVALVQPLVLVEAVKGEGGKQSMFGMMASRNFALGANEWSLGCGNQLQERVHTTRNL